MKPIFAAPFYLILLWTKTRAPSMEATTVKQATKYQENFAQRILHPRRTAIQQSRSMAFRMYKSFRNMVASAIVGGDMSNMNPRIWERAVFSAKELTPGTFRNSLRTSIRVRLPPTGQFAKGALIKLIMAECKKLGAKYLFISEFTTTNSNKKSTKNGVLPPPHLHFPHPPPQRLP